MVAEVNKPAIPKVSVVMAAYNEESNICFAIESILNQTYKSWELILINDCSSDSTLKLMELYKENDRVKIVNNLNNFGLAKSLNLGISEASGTFIARMDADDLSKPDRLALQISFMELHPSVDVLGGGAEYFNNKKSRMIVMPKEHSTIKNFIKKSSPFIHPSVMYKRTFIERLGGYNEYSLRAEDYDLWYRGINNSNYYNLSEPLIEYKEEHKKIMRSTMDCAKVRFKYNPSKLSALYWTVVQLLFLIKNKLYDDVTNLK